MNKIDIFCNKFCSYYKPSEDKKVYCTGYCIAKHFMNLSNDVPVLSQIDIKKIKSIKKLAENICPQCLFYKEDCDFAQGSENALPCGGLIFLAHLVENGKITTKDVNDLKV